MNSLFFAVAESVLVIALSAAVIEMTSANRYLKMAVWGRPAEKKKPEPESQQEIQ